MMVSIAISQPVCLLFNLCSDQVKVNNGGGAYQSNQSKFRTITSQCPPRIDKNQCLEILFKLGFLTHFQAVILSSHPI